MCLRVPFSYIRVAFGLLSDCIFDGGKGYWDRGNRRESACLMLYKFWCHQTGRGILTSSGISGWDKEYRHAMAWSIHRKPLFLLPLASISKCLGGDTFGQGKTGKLGKPGGGRLQSTAWMQPEKQPSPSLLRPPGNPQNLILRITKGESSRRFVS